MKPQSKTKSKKLVCPTAGTATSSPVDKTASQSNMNIVNVMLWMKRSAYGFNHDESRQAAKILEKTLKP